jgi:predicted phosphodiesterase
VRFLCISDVHGELNALRAVLATAERRGYQKLLVAGDLCFPGPEPLETWRTLQREQAICVQGVTDKALATMDPARLEELANDPAQKAMARRFVEARRAVGELVLERLRRMPTHHRIALEDGRELLLVHGSPEDPTDPITHDLDDDEINALIGDDPADIIVCGMSHSPFVREIDDVTVINVGSVGDAPGGGVAHATFIETSARGIIIDPIMVPLQDHVAVGT